MQVQNASIDNIITIALAGSLDKRSVSQVREAIFQAVREQPAEIIINLREVGCIDSSGLAVLVLGLHHAQENRVKLCISDLQSPVRLIFELTRFDTVFKIYVNEEDARLAVLVNSNPQVFIAS